MLSIKLQSGGSGRDALYEDLNWDGNLIQNLQFAFLASAAILLLFSAIRFAAQPRYMRWVVLLAAMGVIFYAGEEIGWGQDITHSPLPRYFAANNVEDRLTIHNLRFADTKQDYVYILEGLAGGLAWLLPASLVAWIPLRKWFIPPWYLSLYFLPLAMDGFLWEVKTKPAALGGVFAGWQRFLNTYLFYADQEPAELLFYSALLVLAIRIVLWGRKAPPSHGS
jgi:hypothetical protein